MSADEYGWKGRGTVPSVSRAYARAAVLGAGPAGLLAAEALSRQGWAITIISRKVPSVISGAQYLHAPIPGFTSPEPDGFLKFQKEGTREGYAWKVYGSPSAPCSWDQFAEGSVPAWSMKKAYDLLWLKWHPHIMDMELTSSVIQHKICIKWDLVVSTIPAHMLCNAFHVFGSQLIRIVPHANCRCPDNHIIYNGDPEEPWYRTSVIFGYGSTEYTTPVPGSIEGRKPLGTNCDCMPKVVRVGRFGQWKKGVLVHHVWDEMSGALYAL